MTKPEEQTKPVSATIGDQLIDSHQFWFKKRLLFNVLVGCAGMLPLFEHLGHLKLFDYIGVLIWGMFANGLYSFGYAIDSWTITRSKGNKSMKNTRLLLFCLGTLAYMCVSLVYGTLYLYGSHICPL